MKLIATARIRFARQSERLEHFVVGELDAATLNHGRPLGLGLELGMIREVPFLASVESPSALAVGRLPAMSGPARP